MEVCFKDFNKCCRCCLLMAEALKPLFGACLDEMLKTLMNLQLTQNDGYPQQICTRCILKLSTAHNFYLTVTNTQKTLEEILKVAKENGEFTITYSSDQKQESNTREKEVDTIEKVPYTKEIKHVKVLPVKPARKAVSRMLAADSGSEDSSDNEGYQCSQCGHTSRDQEKLKTHLQTHVGVKEQPKGDRDPYAQLCNYCGARFRLRTSLFKHVRQHRGRAHVCPHCHKRFAEISTLNVHLVSHSVSAPKPFHCGQCERTFSQKSSLRKHSELHAARPRHQCKECDKTFLYQSSKPFHCGQCERAFSQKSSLRKHSQLRAARPRHQCKECDKTFLYQSSLRRHRESAHLPDKCLLCNKLFCGKKYLDAHMRSHKKDEMDSLKTQKLKDDMMTESMNIQAVTVEFLCLICTQKFQTRECLEVHICSRDDIT